jgi:hypothetical protein
MKIFQLASFRNSKSTIFPKFQLVSFKEDISLMASLRSVCKRWNNIFFDCPLNEATIRYSESIE